MSEPLWITRPGDLLDRLQLAPARVGLDTEFIRERTYWPRLALVQMAVGEDILLVDPLLPGMPAALAAWLDAPDVLKVMHSAGEDLIALRCACATLPRPMFDTQLAAALAGIGAGMGYQKLVEQITGTSLAKGETRSDWLRRPRRGRGLATPGPARGPVPGCRRPASPAAPAALARAPRPRAGPAAQLGAGQRAGGGAVTRPAHR